MTGDTARQGWLRRTARTVVAAHERWTTRDRLAHAIHGAVVGAAATAVSSAHGGTLGTIVLTVVVTVAVYWAAERYADMLATAVHSPRRRVGAVLRVGRPTLQAGLVPLALLIAIALLTGNLPVAVFSALGLATLMLGWLGQVAARHGGATRAAALGWSVCSAALGLVVIALKVALH
ncbi:MAG: hypothetical protein M3235_18520 [Actinomycetota bacterium]|nr:hypothetical protein [Actinomycetota bacterium]